MTLSEARDFAQQFRYAGDVPVRHRSEDASLADSVRSRLATQGLLVSESLVPSVDRALQKAADSLKLGGVGIAAYVIPSATISASCYSCGTDECVVSISSAAIDKLEPEEITFVLGHEIGHFLYAHRHRQEHLSSGPLSIEGYIRNRAWEISADRCGLIACGSMATAIRAIMKTASGLGNEHLRFDVGEFIRELGRLGGVSDLPESTHPPFIVRCRALLWFSMSQIYTGDSSSWTVDRIDERTEKELNKYVDGPANALIEEARNQVILWLAASALAENGVIRRSDWEKLEKICDKDSVERLVGMMEGQPLDEVRSIAQEKLDDAIRIYQQEAPARAQSDLPSLKTEVLGMFMGAETTESEPGPAL